MSNVSLCHCVSFKRLMEPKELEQPQPNTEQPPFPNVYAITDGALSSVQEEDEKEMLDDDQWELLSVDDAPMTADGVTTQGPEEWAAAEREHNHKPSEDYIRRFWMSDRNCDRCGECGVTFHTFRRKHHCRLCGRVFCQTCCSERVNIQKFEKLKKEFASSDDDNVCNGGMMRG